MIEADLVQFGGGIFSKRCQLCGELARPDKDMSVNEFMKEHLNKTPHTVGGKCKEHGRIRLPFVGFESELTSQNKGQNERRV